MYLEPFVVPRYTMHDMNNKLQAGTSMNIIMGPTMSMVTRTKLVSIFLFLLFHPLCIQACALRSLVLESTFLTKIQITNSNQYLLTNFSSPFLIPRSSLLPSVYQNPQSSRYNDTRSSAPRELKPAFIGTRRAHKREHICSRGRGMHSILFGCGGWTKCRAVA